MIDAVAVTVFEDCHAGQHDDCGGETEIDGTLLICACRCHGDS